MKLKDFLFLILVSGLFLIVLFFGIFSPTEFSLTSAKEDGTSSYVSIPNESSDETDLDPYVTLSLLDTSVIHHLLEQSVLPVGLVLGAISCILLIIYINLCENLLQVQKEVTSQKKFLEDIIHHMPIGLVVLDALDNDSCIILNEKILEYTYLPAEALLGDAFSKRKEFQDLKREIVETKSPISVYEKNDLISALPDRYLKYTLSPIYDDSGECIFYAADIVDLTQIEEKKLQVQESLSRLSEFVEQNVAAIGFFRPVFEKNVFVGVTIEQVNTAYKNLFNFPHSDITGERITQDDVQYKWLIEAFSLLQYGIQNLHVFDGFYLDTLNKYISGYAFLCSKDPEYLCVYVTDITEETTLFFNQEKNLKTLEKNIFEMATSNDQVRNPLSVMVMLLEMGSFEAREEILERINKIDSFIDILDRGFTESEALYLKVKKSREK
jgi:hypothetical protein